MAIDDGPIIDNLLPQFGLEGQLEAKEMKEDGTLSKITTEYLGVDTSPDEKYFDETPN